MRFPLRLVAVVLSCSAAQGAIPVDLAGYREGPVRAAASGEDLAVEWADEAGRAWRAVFSLAPQGNPIRSVGFDGKPALADAGPFYQAETGKRRGGWDVFFDYPAAHPDGTRHWHAEYAPRAVRVETVGDRLEVAYDRMRLGPFEGRLVYTIFPGSRLVRQEARLTTWEPDTAYYYDAGIEWAEPDRETPGRNMDVGFVWRDAEGKLVAHRENGLQPERQAEKVRHRALAAEAGAGSLAVFPAPHQYFFPRDFTSNMGYLWRRAWRGRAAVGIRQIRDENWRYYPWMNAPPGTEQRMSVFFQLGADGPREALDDVLRYTNADRYRPLPGYKTVSSHWHLAYTVQAMERGLNWTPPFKPVLKEMGVDASIVMDFHGDGHPADLTELRLRELDAFFQACKAQSDEDFLLIPSEEANVHLGGHWAVVFPRPVYWWMNRPQGGAFETTHPKYGKVYSAADAKEMLDLVRREGGFMYQTHARTKGSTGYPDKIRETEHFLDPSYLGAGWKAMPSDPSSPRLGERVFALLDDMSNWGLPKKILGEVDVFQFDHTHELWAHMNVNYVKAERLPEFDRYQEILAPIVAGEFFVTTGEVLLPRWSISTASAEEIRVEAEVEWTFPLRFAEIVWGDGEHTERRVVSLEQTRPFGKQSFAWRVPAKGWKWARLAVWDVAANGAFVNPVRR